MLCEVQGCGYKTPESQPGLAIRWLTLHQKYVHSEDDITQSAKSVEVATDISTKEGFILPAKYAAPVRQVKDSEDVAFKPVHTAQSVQEEKVVTKRILLNRAFIKRLCRNFSTLFAFYGGPHFLIVPCLVWQAGVLY